MPCADGCIFDSSIQTSAGAFNLPTWTPTLIVVPDGFNIVTGLYCTPQWKPWPRPVSPWVPPTGLPCQTFVPGFPWPPYPGWPGIDQTPPSGGGTGGTGGTGATGASAPFEAHGAMGEPEYSSRRKK